MVFMTGILAILTVIVSGIAMYETLLKYPDFNSSDYLLIIINLILYVSIMKMWTRIDGQDNSKE